MNILFVTPSLPTRYQRIRAFQLIKYLSRVHDVHLVSLSDKKAGDFGELGRYCKSIEVAHQPKWKSLVACLLYLLTPVPLEVAYCKNWKMRRLVRRAVEKKNIDIVYVKRLRSAQFVPNAVFRKAKVYLDTTDAMSLYYKRALRNVPFYKKPLFFEECVKYLLYEKKIFKKFKDWIVCSEDDMSYLKKRAPENVNFFLVPNGVDAEFFGFDDGDGPEKHSVIVSGLMDKFVNEEAALFFAKEVFPFVVRKISGAKLYIVGPRPSSKIRALAKDNIIISGDVPVIREAILKSEVVVCPVKTGAGTKNKILQAWSIGRPVVTTSMGFRGLEGEHGTHVLIADEPRNFADKVMLLMEDRRAYAKLVANGYDIIKEKYGMETIIRDLDAILCEARPRS